MGYKTTDYTEKERLEKEGHKVIACKGILKSGPEYEFDFDKEEIKNVEIVSIPAVVGKEEKSIEENKDIKEPPKKRGNPKWFKGMKK